MTGETIEVSTQSALAQARGAGSAREGAEHWGAERLAAVTTLALIVWLAVSLARLPGLDHATVTQWLKTPLAAVPMLLLIVSLFRHLQMGLIQVIDDYAHDDGNRMILTALVTIASLFTAALALFAVLKIALGAGAAA
jgi:succinate dehydrogenase / fumarate reductase membrane anchor subunit